MGVESLATSWRRAGIRSV